MSGGTVAEQNDLPLEDEPKEESKEEPKAEISQKDLDALTERAAALETTVHAGLLERARLEERLKTTDKKEPEAPPPPNSAELQEWVDAGRITQAQADDEKMRQLREGLRADLSKEFDEKGAVRDQARVVEAEFDSYVAMRPDVAIEGTEDRRKFQVVYDRMLKRGLPHDKRTEVAAMESAFGPVDRVQETTRKRRETTREAGGAAAAPGASGSGDAAWKKDCTPDFIAGVEKQIGAGALSGYDDPRLQRQATRHRNQRKAS